MDIIFINMRVATVAPSFMFALYGMQHSAIATVYGDDAPTCLTIIPNI